MKLLSQIIKWWKNEADPDLVFCDDHTWVGSIAAQETCPLCRARNEAWERSIDPLRTTVPAQL